jgi:hypothetical protein
MPDNRLRESAMRGQGFLAVWCEIGDEDRADYRNWETQEHIAERMTLPGFLGMRMFASVADPGAHFFLYSVAEIGALRSPEYRAILDNPSPWTKRLVPKFGAFDRGVGQVALKIGRGFGAYVLASRLKTDGSALDLASTKAALGTLIDLPDTVGVRLLAVDPAATGVRGADRTVGRAGQDGNFSYALVVESMSEAGAEWACERLHATLPHAIPGLLGFDHLICRMLYADMPHEGASA